MKEGDLVVPIFNGGCRDCKYCMCEKTNMSQRFGVNPMKKVMASDGTTKVFYNGWKTHLPFLEHFNFRRVHSGGFSILSDLKNKKLVLPPNVAEGGTSQRCIQNYRRRHQLRQIHQRIRKMTSGDVHYSFECAGNLNVIRDAFLSAHMDWGLTVILGIHPSPKLLPIHPMELFQGRRIVGSVFGGFKGKTQLPRFAKECMDGVVKLDDFITHEFQIEEINKACDLFTVGKSLRSNKETRYLNDETPQIDIFSSMRSQCQTVTMRKQGNKVVTI
ncbi:hypothetical protein JHK85_001449 [Glycine max]|nr:hypothetical protein JHK85_001449 [Glycine max]